MGIVNICLSMTETCLIIRTNLQHLQRSELFALMVCGLSTASFTALFAYVNLGANIDYLIVSAIISIPCSFALAKIFEPPTRVHDYLSRSEITPLRNRAHLMGPEIIAMERRIHFLDKCSESIRDAGTVIQLIIGNLIAIMSFVTFLDRFVSFLTRPFVGSSINNNLYHNHDIDLGLIKLLTYITGWFFMGLGVDSADILIVGEIFIRKILINEFAAFKMLGKVMHKLTTTRSLAVANVLLCGFGNISAAGMLSAIISSLSNNKVQTTSILFKALAIACLVNIYCACTISILLD